MICLVIILIASYKHIGILFHVSCWIADIGWLLLIIFIPLAISTRLGSLIEIEERLARTPFALGNFAIAQFYRSLLNVLSGLSVFSVLLVFVALSFSP